MYAFGKFKEIKACEIEDLINESKIKSDELSNVSITHILEVLNKLSYVWKPGSMWYNKALKELPNELSFSKEMIEHTLNLVSGLLDYDSLRKRLESEFQNINTLDNFSTHNSFEGKIKNISLGKLLHVSAGNVFLGCIDSLLMGFLTKNINFLKLSSKNQVFPKIFAQSLMEVDSENVLSDKFSILYWKGGDKDFEDCFKQNVDAIMAWGGESMLEAYKKNLPMNVKLIDYGPKISIQVITNEYFKSCDIESLANSIVKDIAMWDQSACAASQNLYVEDGVDIDLLMTHVSKSFQRFSIPRAKLESDEYVDILKEKARAQYNRSLSGIDFIEGNNYFIHYEPNDVLRPSALNRSLIIKSFTNVSNLSESLKTFKYYLQTCGLATTLNERNLYLNKLAHAGVKRFTLVGKMLEGMSGAPHDGRFCLTELVNTVSFEHVDGLDEFLDNVRHESKAYQYLDDCFIDNFPIIDSSFLIEHGPGSKDESLITSKENSYIFASGGTSGKPKFSMYKKDEFDKTCRLLAKSYMHSGLQKGDVVANFFVSGNMWSSFSAVQLALINCPVTQLPIGGKASNEDIRVFVKKFRPNVFFGIPGMLVDLSIKNPDFNVTKIFYAGEVLKESSVDILKKNWGVREFISAGYASVDVGPIGYQVPGGKIGEHYLFEHIYPEIINEQFVVTSTLRKSMPIIRYATGDRVEMLEKDSHGQKIFLHGRYDSLIQIWSCRFNLKLIDDFFKDYNCNYQVILNIDNVLGETLKILVNNGIKPISFLEFSKYLYKECTDINQTVSLEFIKKHIFVEQSSLFKNERTGKTSKLIDLR